MKPKRVQAERGARNEELENAEWITVRLGDVVEINPRLGIDVLSDDSDVGFVPMAAVCQERKSIVAPERRTFSQVRKGYTPMRKGDIIVAKITPCFENGKAARVDLASEISFGSTEFHVFRPRPAIDSNLLFHLLSSNQIREEGAERMTGAAGQKRVPAEFFRAFEFRVPRSLVAQKRIAGILDAADALRAKRRAALAQLDALAQSLFLDLFGDPVTNPKGWGVVAVTSICRPKQWPTIGRQDLLPQGYPVYGANGTIGFYSSFNHLEPTVLITCRGATCGSINVCEPRSYVTGNAMALDEPDPSRVKIKFLEHCLRNIDFSAVITGVAQPQITRQSLGHLSLPLPPLPLQKQFAAAVEAIERQKARQREQLAGLDALFASLQHRAFRGEL